MQFINLTAHSINEVTSGLTIPASGRVVRVKSSTTKVAEHAGSPIYTSVFGEVEGLPEPVDGILYIVSALALNACPNRIDLVAPGNLMRNPEGQPIGCVGFRK
jgi:hypothetical protein